MSLAPAVHIAVLDADRIHGSLAEAMRREHWAEGMPTNALLISGPSKTADIELVLTFGVHGPKELIVLILDDCFTLLDPRLRAGSERKKCYATQRAESPYEGPNFTAICNNSFRRHV
jgi:hypothetical protein